LTENKTKEESSGDKSWQQKKIKRNFTTFYEQIDQSSRICFYIVD